ncbi:hypothetical protein ACOMHN_004871 [Nucella lapillus]
MWRRKDTVVIILLPLCLLPLLLTVDSKEARCGYGVGVTVGVWVTHSLPLGMTALLPLLILPLTGVSAVHDVSSHYVNVEVGWVEVGWVEVGWVEVVWVEVGWVEVGWVEVGWVEVGCVEVGWVEVGWVEVG